MPEHAPDPTAVRTALWRALHLQLDAPPHVVEDDLGLRLAAPAEGWQRRPDMHPEGTRAFRASIVARARFIEDLVEAELRRGVDQYVLLGAGLDTFAERRPDLDGRLHIFEVDRAGPQAWKRGRLAELGLPAPPNLRFVPVDFEADTSWVDRLVEEGFALDRPAVVASAGVSMYLTREANEETLRRVACLAPGSTFVMTFLVPIELTAPDARHGLEQSARGARASGTPFVSFFAPDDAVGMARAAGFRDARHVSSAWLGSRYFGERTDGLRPPAAAEEILVATT